jgi:hypothetical protein
MYDWFEGATWCSTTGSMCSEVDVLLFVVNFGVQWVEVSNQSIFLERDHRLHIIWFGQHKFIVQFTPSLVVVRAVVVCLVDSVNFPSCWSQLECFIKCVWINFFEDSFQSYQTLLEDFMPVIFSKINDDRNEHWESLLFVGLQDVQEVVVFKETHSTVCNLQMDATNALDYPLEKAGDQRLNLFDFANFKDFL